MADFKTGNRRPFLIRGIAGVIWVLLLWVGSRAVSGQTTTPSSRSSGPGEKVPKTITLPEAISLIRQSTVQINYLVEGEPGTFTKPQMGLFGTGFDVGDGYFITAKHVVDAFQTMAINIPKGKKSLGIGIASINRLNVRAGFRVFEVEVIDQDAIHDLALLHEIHRDTPLYETLGSITFGSSSGLSPQDPIFPTLEPVRLSIKRPEDGDGIATSGYPLNQAVLLTTSGTVASSWGFYDSTYAPPNAPAGFAMSKLEDSYLADLRVNHGNSGGPVYSITTGAVVGVCQAYENAEVAIGNTTVIVEGKPLVYNSGVSLFVPARYVAALLDKNKVKWTAAK
ncbi:MAG TPA: serine protease [Candidatus Saccharimonadales bacterium]|nr:serine protease [Candidatus Saccharimonadales bacterium]